MLNHRKREHVLEWGSFQVCWYQLASVVAWQPDGPRTYLQRDGLQGRRSQLRAYCCHGRKISEKVKTWYLIDWFNLISIFALIGHYRCLKLLSFGGVQRIHGEGKSERINWLLESPMLIMVGEELLKRYYIYMVRSPLFSLHPMRQHRPERPTYAVQHWISRHVRLILLVETVCHWSWNVCTCLV